MQLKSKITTNMNFPTNSSSAKVKMSSICVQYFFGRMINFNANSYWINDLKLVKNTHFLRTLNAILSIKEEQPQENQLSDWSCLRLTTYWKPADDY